MSNVIIIGTLYEPNWGGIAWSQPIPGGLVFPQQQLNVPFTAYPVPGQLWAENSGLWVALCGHWINEPMIFQDTGGKYVITLAYAKDSSGQIWRIGVLDNGLLETIPISYNVGVPPIYFTDLVVTQTWQLGVQTNGDLTLTPVGGGGGVRQLLVESPNGSVFGVQVSNGLYQTMTMPAASNSGQVALVCCPMCTVIQYVMPVAQFYSTFLDPVTFI